MAKARGTQRNADLLTRTESWWREIRPYGHFAERYAQLPMFGVAPLFHGDHLSAAELRLLAEVAAGKAESPHIDQERAVRLLAGLPVNNE